MVLRHLNSGAQVVNARQFGMNGKNYRKFQRMLQNSNGIIYLTGNDAVRNLIRENKGHQIASLMQTGSKEGMRMLAQDLARLTMEGRIAAESAYAVCPGPDDLRQYLEAGVPGRF